MIKTNKIESAYRSVSTELEELKAQQRTYTEKCNTFKNIQEKLNEQHIELKSKITAANQQILDLKRQNRSLETQVSLVTLNFLIFYRAHPILNLSFLSLRKK